MARPGACLPPGGNPDFAYFAVRRGSLGGENIVFTHELGHVLGCTHDREHTGDLTPEFLAARPDYIFGHRFVVEGITYIDVMSYEPGIRLPIFGNPAILLDGVPTGAGPGTSHPADGARTVNEFAPYVARYRTAISRIEFESEQQVCRGKQWNSFHPLETNGRFERNGPRVSCH